MSNEVNKEFDFPTPQSLVEVLQQNVSKHPNKVLLTWLESNGEISSTLTYIELWRASNAVVDLLTRRSVQPGDRVMIAYPFGPEFLAGMFGCMLAGIIPCSVYPPDPRDKKRAKHVFEQFRNQVSDAGAKYALTATRFKLLMTGSSMIGYKTGVVWLATDNLDTSKVNRAPNPSSSSKSLLHQVKSSDIAFIQYSSGSTSTPKGVMISHGAIMHNLSCGYRSNYFDNDGRKIIHVVTWLPQYHDYGLITAFLMCVYAPTCPLIAFSPIDFIRNPILWADVIEKFGAEQTAGPNFAYSLLAKRMKEANRVLKVKHPVRANISAEPIAPSTLQAMVDIGFQASAINPSYGLAECCAYVTQMDGENVKVLDGVVSVGDVKQASTFDIYCAVADPESREIITDGSEGEVCISSPSLASGYWNQPEASSVFRALEIDGRNYYATGDMGRIVDDRLYICGRLKELIIINGKNIYPIDIERTIEQEFLASVRPGSTVAYQNTPTSVGIVLEIRDKILLKKEEHTLMCEDVRKIVQDMHSIVVTSVYILKQGTVPKTTSGKLRRLHAKECSIARCWGAHDIINQFSSVDKEKRGKQENIVSNDISLKDFYSVIKPYVGEVEKDQGWEEIGLTSMVAVEVRDAIQIEFKLFLPLDCFEIYSTPSLLENYVLENSEIPVGTAPVAELPCKSKNNLSWQILVVMQCLGVAALLLLFTASTIPVWHLSKTLSMDSTTELVTVNSARLAWMWIPVAIPSFFITFSVLVIIMKWIVVGQYQAFEINVPSVEYFQWWMVDRAVQLWEIWVGRFLQDTFLLWLFYRLMGAKIHPAAKLNAFVREFDLVQISRNVQLDHSISCKRFSPWKEGQIGPRLRFRPIKLEDSSCVKGMVSLGSVVCAGAVVRKCSVVPECGYVDAGRVVKGKPAFCSRKSIADSGYAVDWIFEIIKIMWLILELYNFMALVFVTQLLYQSRLPQDLHFSGLSCWFLYILTVNVLLLVENVILKWVLVGKRRPGRVHNNTLRKTSLWAADYHYKLSVAVLLGVTSNSALLWNSYLKLMGMDIDLASQIAPASFLPSTVDLISVKNSFTSTVSFDVENKKQLKRIQLSDTMIGYNSHVAAGVTLLNMLIPSITLVQTTSSEQQVDKRANLLTKQQRNQGGLILLALYTVMIAVVFLSLVPAYELWFSVFDPQTIYMAIPVLAICLLLQTFVWMVIIRILQFAAYGSNTNKLRAGPTGVLCFLYLSYCWAVQTWSFLVLFHGTPMFNWIARFMGTKVQGRALCFPRRIYDWSFITIKDRTVVDNAFLNGHFGVYQEMTLGPSKVSGLVHEGCWVAAGADMMPEETGPYALVLKSVSENVTENVMEVLENTTRSRDDTANEITTFDVTHLDV